MNSPRPHIHSIYHEITATISYVVFDAANGHAAIIDPVLNYDTSSGTTDTNSADSIDFFGNRSERAKIVSRSAAVL